MHILVCTVTPACPLVLPQVMSGLQGVDGILDDLIITGSNDERQLSNLKSALERMSGMGIKLKKEKCLFKKPTVEYFAFVMDTRRLVRFKLFLILENPKELKCCLGMLNCYRIFIPETAT